MCLWETLYSPSKEALHSEFYLFTHTLFADKPSSSKLFCLCSESKEWITVLIKVSVLYLCYFSSYTCMVNKELKIGHRLSSLVFGDYPRYKKVLNIPSSSVFWLIFTCPSRFFFKSLSKLNADHKINWIVMFAQCIIRNRREVRPLATLAFFLA